MKDRILNLIPHALLGLIILMCVTIVVESAMASFVGRRMRENAVATIASTTMDAASTTFEYELENQESWGLAVVYVSVTDANNSVTDVTMKCTSDENDNGTDYDMIDCAVSAGVCTTAIAQWSYNPSSASSPKQWAWRVDIEGFEDFECTFTDTGGAIDDTIAVSVSVAAK